MHKDFASRIIYPGLFQPSGIEFDLPETAVVTVTITDAAGDILTTPVHEQRFEKGTHEAVFTIPARKSGNLFYSITAEMHGTTLTERKKLK